MLSNKHSGVFMAIPGTFSGALLNLPFTDPAPAPPRNASEYAELQLYPAP
jgi:hypothetical protein